MALFCERTLTQSMRVRVFATILTDGAERKFNLVVAGRAVSGGVDKREERKLGYFDTVVLNDLDAASPAVGFRQDARHSTTPIVCAWFVGYQGSAYNLAYRCRPTKRLRASGGYCHKSLGLGVYLYS